MKKILLTLAFMFVALAARPQTYLSELTISIHDYTSFQVAFDDQYYTTHSGILTIKGIEPGRHDISIHRHAFGSANRWRPTRYAPTLMYFGYIYIPAKSRVYALYDRFNGFVVYSYVPIRESVVIYEDLPVLSPKDFRHLKDSITVASSEQKRIEIAKQAVSSNKVTSQMVFEIMQLLTAESSRLEFAKLAYENTIDKERYFVVNKAFTSGSSVEELNSFISE